MVSDRRRPSVRATLDGVASILMIAASIIFIWISFSIQSGVESAASRRPVATPPTKNPLPIDPVSINTSRLIRGATSAQLIVIEYSDFECPYCARFARDTLPRIFKTYVETGKVLFAFRHFPLETIHPSARKAAEAAECAARQGKFWMFHDLLFQRTTSLAHEAYAARAGLNPAQFERCLGGEAADQIGEDLKLARTLQISGTPTFLFGRRLEDGRIRVLQRESGALPFEAFGAIVDRLLGSTASVAK